MSSGRDPVERVLDVVVFAPIGAAVAVGGLVRSVAERLPVPPLDALRRVAPGTGAGGPIDERLSALKDRVCNAVAMVRGVVAASAAEPVTSPPPSPAADVEVARPAVDVPDVGDLAIEGYDHLAAQQVVDRLEALTDEQLDAVERYESAHRRRRTVLGKIDQLRS